MPIMLLRKLAFLNAATMAVARAIFRAAFVTLFFVDVNTDYVKTFYFSELCYTKNNASRYIALGSTSTSVNSSAVIKSISKVPPFYNWNMRCKVTVIRPEGHKIVASFQKIDFRSFCVDSLTISDEHGAFKHRYCDHGLDQDGTTNISVEGNLIIEFISSSAQYGHIFNHSGFQLTVTAYREGSCRSDTEFSCKNRRCISKELLCDKLDHCGDDSNHECEYTCLTPDFACTNGACISSSKICENENGTCGDGSDIAYCDKRRKEIDSGCTNKNFACANGKCVPISYWCNGDYNCEDGTDEQFCDPERGCRPPKFLCPNRQCVSSVYVCDGRNDCGDWSDEKNCSSVTRPPSNCVLSNFTCQNGKCIEPPMLCNGYDNCGDMSDEANCHSRCAIGTFPCQNGRCINLINICDGENDCGDWSEEENCRYNCPKLQFTCANGKCISWAGICNGEDDCGDESDENFCEFVCTYNEFRCANIRCIKDRQVCDGHDDCGDGSDEVNCTSICLPDNFKCLSGRCVKSLKFCGGHDNCEDEFDESACKYYASLSGGEIAAIVVVPLAVAGLFFILWCTVQRVRKR